MGIQNKRKKRKRKKLKALEKSCGSEGHIYIFINK
jgi:hypothetical protein